MTLAQLLVVYDPRDIASLEFGTDGANITRVVFNSRHQATAQDMAVNTAPPAAEKPGKLRASSAESLVNPLPLHCID